MQNLFRNSHSLRLLLITLSANCGIDGFGAEINYPSDLDSISQCTIINGDLIIRPYGPFDSSVTLPSGLHTVAGYLMFVFDNFNTINSIAASGLTTIGPADNTTTFGSAGSGGLIIEYFNALTSMSFPLLNSISLDFWITDNPNVKDISGFPVLSQIGAFVTLEGDFDSVELPALTFIGGNVFISTSSSSFQCPFTKLQEDGAVHGTSFVCESVGTSPDAQILNSIIQEEIMCYGIPYGGIGFASHIITYYTIIALWFGVKPFMPRSPLTHHKWDGFMAFVTLAGGNAMAIVTVIRCRKRWQFVLIAVWKICLSTTLALTAFTNAVILSIRKANDDDPGPDGQPLPSIMWIGLYVLGLIIGMVGVFSLVKETWLDNSKVRLITYGFGGISGGIIALAMLGGIAMVVTIFCDGDDDVFSTGCGTFLGAAPFGGAVLFVILGVFYSDWILGAIAGNLAGEPSSDVVLIYWLYFAFKRVSLFSF